MTRDSSTALPLYLLHELAFRTQYEELKERARAAGTLLPGTPGRLVLRTGTGYGYWYRGYYAAPGEAVEDLVCKDGDDAALEAERGRIAIADWMARQVRDLRKLQFQVADKAVARVLVELHNAGWFAAGLVLTGTLGFMAWLNELGAKAVAARTQDIDLARRQALRLAAPRPFLDTLQATRLRFHAVPALDAAAPSTSVKRAGAEGLRIDMLTPGATLGRIVPLPELQWHARTVPHYGWLLADARDAAVLAGGQCIPVRLPAPERFVWHKLYSAAARRQDAGKAEKDLRQAATLAAVLAEHDLVDWRDSVDDVPPAVRRAARGRIGRLRRLLSAHAQALEQIEGALA